MFTFSETSWSAVGPLTRHQMFTFSETSWPAVGPLMRHQMFTFSETSWPAVGPLMRHQMFTFSKTSWPAVGPTHFKFSACPGGGGVAVSPVVKRPGDLSPPSSAGIKTQWSRTSSTPICPHGILSAK